MEKSKPFISYDSHPLTRKAPCITNKSSREPSWYVLQAVLRIDFKSSSAGVCRCSSVLPLNNVAVELPIMRPTSAADPQQDVLLVHNTSSAIDMVEGGGDDGD